MTERAQALEALKRVARDIGTVKDVASRRSDPDRDNRRMLARLSAWRSEILRALNILEAVPPRPPVGSPTTPDMGQGWFVTAGRWGDSIVTIEEKSLSGKPDFTPEDQALVRGAALHLLAFIGQPTPVAPAGASESPSEMDSGIVLLVSAASAASGYLERQQPDLAAWLWNAVQLVLNSQSAPVSPVEPAGASEPPMEREDVGQHQHEFAEVEVCRHCLRTEADIEGTCHHCDEGTGARCWWCLKLKSASAQASDPPKTWIPTEGCSCYLCRAARLSPTPVSPVAPEPPTETECCREPIAADERFCQKCGHEARIQPAGEPAPCVWREEWVEYGNNHGRDEVKTGCGLSEDADEMRPLMKWPFCPQCGSPLKVER